MTRTYHLTGQTSLLGGVFRGFIAMVVLIGGFFMLAASAALAFFIAAGLVILAALAFVVFWTKAKITGRPFGPRAHFERRQSQFQTDLESQLREAMARRQAGGAQADTQASASKQTADKSGPISGLGAGSISGPVIDMHETPEGWSVDN